MLVHDGRLLEVRPMRPDDAARLRRFHGTLSNETTRLRFFSVHPELTENEVDRFTHVDHHDREALVATVDGDIIGVTRFDRLADRPAEAEVAFVVTDDWQGCGIGSALFEQLATRARRAGIERFVAETLPHNQRMLTVFHHSGLPCRSSYRDGVVHVVMELGAAPDVTAQEEPRPPGTRHGG
jgi:GNAT superfamily N-acetyltransferase